MFSKFPSLLLVAALAPLRAQEAFNPPAPFVALGQTAPAVGGALAMLGAARSAQEMGLPSVAVTLYREVLAAPAGTGGDRAQIALALTTALLDDGDVAGAAQGLQEYSGARGSAWHLRAGLIAAYQKKVAAVKAELAEVRRDELAPADVGWWFFLQGMLANVVGDSNKALDFYSQAGLAAQSDVARARFLLAQYQARLKLGSVRESDIEAVRKNADANQGKSVGYGFARDYAIMLDVFGRKGAAVDVLQRQLRSLPPQERGEADNFRLFLGLIAGAGDGAGRNALSQLLTTGSDPEKQRIALQLLASASLSGPARVDFRSKLDELIKLTPSHRILEDLLLFRAQAALAERSPAVSSAQAETDAKTLLQKFPGSQLKAPAYGVLTSAAWARGFYRQAADYAAKARAELPAGQVRAELGVLVAEAWYRAGDFRTAAEAYSAALRERPEGLAPGVLMFQRVLAEIKAAQLDPSQQATGLLAVQPTLDEFAREPTFDALNHWQAEWNLARSLQAAGQTAAAYARVNKLLATPPTGSSLPAELRVRMAWLQARLALDADQPEQTLRLADELLGARDAQSADLRTETVLLKAQATFALGREVAGVEILKKLREDFPKSDAAARSYIVEADYDSDKDRIVEAQQLLTDLAENKDFKDSRYALYALFRAALLAERRGQEKDFVEANRLLEQLVTRDLLHEFVFTARLKQGDLLRKLGQFPQAQQVYENIVNEYPQHPGGPAALLALADCHSLQAPTDAAHAQRAEEIYERLLAQPGAQADLRVEAGVKLGLALKRRGDFTLAVKVWYGDVVEYFLLHEERAARLGATGRYWMARALVELGDLLEKQGKLDEAKTAWQRILVAKLPGRKLAEDRLGRFNPAEAKP
ncbi:MAG: tetratricopeptide repeat protein [Opitutaceae bacterium]|nr:tetratricopeptide repeat protein [Opitutaceae bacterium]